MPLGPKPNGVGAPGTYQFDLLVRNDLPAGAYSLFVSTDLSVWTPLDSCLTLLIVAPQYHRT